MSEQVKTEKLSKQQKEILDWIAKEMKLDGVVEAALKAKGLGLLKKMMAATGLTNGIGVYKKHGVKWDARRFLGNEQLTDKEFHSKSVSLSESLKRLEEGGLVKRTRSRGKRARTSHVKLTHAGFLYWQHLNEKG